MLAAYRQIAERGFEGLRTREVADAVGVNVATLHYHFPTKEALIAAVVQHAMDRFRTTLEPHGSPASQLRNYLRATRNLMRNEPELGAVMSELALRSVRDPGTRKILDSMYGVWHATVRGLLRRAAKEGGIRPDADSDQMAALIVATLTGMSIPQMANGRLGDQALKELERLMESSN